MAGTSAGAKKAWVTRKAGAKADPMTAKKKASNKEQDRFYSRAKSGQLKSAYEKMNSRKKSKNRKRTSLEEAEKWLGSHTF